MKADRVWKKLTLAVLLATALGWGFQAQADDLQGQHSDGFGHAQGTWVSGNLQNWRELDYIPCRMVLTGGPVSNKVVSVEFPHTSGGTPGIQNLTGFSSSANVEITSGPTLNSSTETWKYSITVNLKNNQAGTIQFFARMRAGAHRFTGSSLKLLYPPLQIHKPNPGAGIPDLSVKKIGPASAGPGELITYTIFYTNRVSAANAATGVQLTDVLPDSLDYVPGSASNGGEIAGNNIVWDLPNLPVGATGSVTYQAIVKSNVASGSSFRNSVEILSAEDDFNYADNTSFVTTVVRFNRAPVANPDSYAVNEDTMLEIGAAGVLANDTDADGDVLTAASVSGPLHGTLTLNADGSFRYSPQANFYGVDSFQYRSSDGVNNSDAATVTITVNAINDAPVANNDAYEVLEGGTLTRNAAQGVLANDTDAETNALTAILVSGPSRGTLTLNSNGSFTYIHDGSETKSDTFAYKANDGALDSGIATVSITILPVNDAPVANNDAYEVLEGGTLARNAAQGVLANDTDAETNALTAILVSGPSHGTLTLNSNGSFIYVHDGSETKSDAFTYKANDGALDSGVATVTITISAVNDAPVANNDAYEVLEGGTLTRNAAQGVLANDTDAETNALTAILVSSPSRGTLTLNSNGSFTYIHDGSETKSDTFAYKANDGALDSSVATVTITISAVNDAPVANNDAYEVLEGGTLTRGVELGVLANDTDAETNALTAILVSGPSHGTLTLNSNGSFTYVHDGSETKSDAFTYKANDGALDSGIATVAIAISSVNDAPVANDDSYEVIEAGTLTRNAAQGVLTNDTDAETNALTAILVSGPSHGTLTLNANGSFTYIHDGSETKSDTFIYKANDGALDSGVATVTITILPVNDAPVANNDAYEVLEGGTLTRNVTQGVLANDTDAETNALTAILVSGPSHGILTLNSNGSLTYIHHGSETKTDTFTYKANDGALDSGIATVTIMISAVNDAPVANNDAYEVLEGGTLTRNAAQGVLANDTDAETNVLTAILVSGPSRGTLTLNANGSFTYIHDGSETKSDAFTYKANDAALDSGVATVTITILPVNDAPIANNDSYEVLEGGTLTRGVELGVLANDTDAETNALTAILVSGPSHGTLTLNSNGSFTYVHDGSETKVDRFTYKANDGALDSGVATVTIGISSVNDAPVANNDAYEVLEGGTLTRNAAQGVLANDTDAETNALTAILVSGPSHGTLTLNSNGSFTYVHDGSETKSDTFAYKANDGALDSGVATVMITILPVNDAPVANNDAYEVLEGGTLTRGVELGVLANDTDAETNALTAILVSGPSHGILTLNSNGSFTYIHDGSETKTDIFTYKANDGALDSGIATVTITISAVNDAPVANNDAYEVLEGGTLTRNAAQGVLANDTDAETNVLTAILISGPSHGTLTLNSNGSFTYIHDGSETKTDTFTYKANDGALDSGVATVTITISAVNDAPVANNDAYEVLEGGTLTRNAAQGVLANDTDAEANALTAILVSGPSHGALTLNSNGSFSYIHDGSETKSDAFTYKANDGALDSDVATVTIAISAVNDVPVANNDSYEVNEDTPLTILAPGVLANDTDAETNRLNAVQFATMTHGTVRLEADGSFVYTPAPDFNGSDSFTYRASDGTATSEVATVSITVRPVNDAPSFTGGTGQVVIRNSGVRTVANWATNIKAGPANEQDQTTSFRVSNNNPGLFLQQPAISPNGTLSFAPAFDAFGTATVTVTLQDNGGTANGGVDTSAPQAFAITVNSPPSINLVTPTNGSTFIWGQNITLLADASDPDGSVTNVQFFQGTNKAAAVASAPYFQVLTNLEPGVYQFSATATDNLGLSATSKVVTVTVLGSLPFTQAGPMFLNPQTGLIEQHLLVTNPTPISLSAARVLVFGLPANARVYNASGTNNGVPFVQYNQPILPGGSAEMLIEYYVPTRIPPATTLVMEVVPSAPAAEASGAQQKVDRALRFTGGTFLLEFTSVTNRYYAIQYSSDLKTWKTVTPSIPGNGSKVQWIDNGSPKTESLPANSGQRFYRILLLP